MQAGRVMSRLTWLVILTVAHAQPEPKFTRKHAGSTRMHLNYLRRGPLATYVQMVSRPRRTGTLIFRSFASSLSGVSADDSSSVLKLLTYLIRLFLARPTVI